MASERKAHASHRVLALPRPQLNLLSAPGDIARATGGDLLARDTPGVLWLYLGKGDDTFTARRQIGGDWQQFTHLAPFDDQNRDGRVDLYALTATVGC
ncbi:hypothetical protein [Streptomyces sp. NPDC090298]|uniref:hypothetical protein n=1 Tax=Streptomyces sp. NPDC090298 TaxID=3365959 RepID=UPI0038120A1D